MAQRRKKFLIDDRAEVGLGLSTSCGSTFPKMYNPNRRQISTSVPVSNGQILLNIWKSRGSKRLKERARQKASLSPSCPEKR